MNLARIDPIRPCAASSFIKPSSGKETGHLILGASLHSFTYSKRLAQYVLSWCSTYRQSGTVSNCTFSPHEQHKTMRGQLNLFSIQQHCGSMTERCNLTETDKCNQHQCHGSVQLSVSIYLCTSTGSRLGLFTCLVVRPRDWACFLEICALWSPNRLKPVFAHADSI